MNQASKGVAALVGAGATDDESLYAPDSLFTLALFPCLEMTPQASHARMANTPPCDFERVEAEEHKRQADLLALRRWSAARGHPLASQARRNRFRRVWVGSLWGEAA